MAQTNAQLDNVTHLAALEIGGSNGMINLIAGSTKYLNLPIIDGDFMGRAYPTGWQTTPNVYDKGNRAEMLLPAAMCSGDGSTVVFVILMFTSLLPCVFCLGEYRLGLVCCYRIAIFPSAHAHVHAHASSRCRCRCRWLSLTRSS